MEITPIGWILIPVVAFGFVFNSNMLYWLMIFFLPFSATAITNVDFSGSRSGVQAAIVFGSLWVLREAASTTLKSSIWRSQHVRSSIFQLTIFMVVVLLSLAMPVFINGRLTVDCPELGCNTSAALTFSMRHLTQTIYLAYGLIITIFIAIRNSDFREFQNTIRILFFSSIFVSCWGLLQWLCYRANVSYPALIF